MTDTTTVVELNIDPTDLTCIVEEWAQRARFSVYEKTGSRTIYVRNIRLIQGWLSVEHMEITRDSKRGYHLKELDRISPGVFGKGKRYLFPTATHLDPRQHTADSLISSGACWGSNLRSPPVEQIC